MDHLLDVLHEEPGFLAQRDAAETAWDHRFKEHEIPCPARCARGWHEDIGDWFRCAYPGCDLGEVVVALCVRCQLDENNCSCRPRSQFVHIDS